MPFTFGLFSVFFLFEMAQKIKLHCMYLFPNLFFIDFLELLETLLSLPLPPCRGVLALQTLVPYFQF